MEAQSSVNRIAAMFLAAFTPIPFYALAFLPPGANQFFKLATNSRMAKSPIVVHAAPNIGTPCQMTFPQGDKAVMAECALSIFYNSLLRQRSAA